MQFNIVFQTVSMESASAYRVTIPLIESCWLCGVGLRELDTSFGGITNLSASGVGLFEIQCHVVSNQSSNGQTRTKPVWGGYSVYGSSMGEDPP
jgi:hypothetical protein